MTKNLSISDFKIRYVQEMNLTNAFQILETNFTCIGYQNPINVFDEFGNPINVITGF